MYFRCDLPLPFRAHKVVVRCSPRLERRYDLRPEIPLERVFCIVRITRDVSEAMVGSEGERALTICLDIHDVFSRRVSLAHPRAKYGLALRLRALCRHALPLGSVLHHRLCWKLPRHYVKDVRNRIW